MFGASKCYHFHGAAHEAPAERDPAQPAVWLLALAPVLFAAHTLKPQAHTPLFVLSVLAIVPLAGLLSHATESVAAKTGDTVGACSTPHWET